MQRTSRPVSSTQQGIHEHLASQVAKHAGSTFRKPIADYNQAAFEQSMRLWNDQAPLILDAGCGVGWSTIRLAEQHPDHFVIGVDQSADRLSRGKHHATQGGPAPDNMLLVRADLVDYWRLLHRTGTPIVRHYLLYPNPWPKIGHLSRRWHGHAVFPTIVALGGQLECRSNWRIYIDELAAALGQLSGQSIATEPWQPGVPLTPFEEKYLASGHALWRCQVQLTPTE